MKILLLGEYSNVHATLAEGLRALGHTVTVASNGDFWKNYPADISLKRTPGKVGGVALMLKLATVLPRLRGYDIVQLINPMFMELKAERLFHIYGYLKKHNKAVVLGAFGMDWYWVKTCTFDMPLRYSDFNIGTQRRTNTDAIKEQNDWLGTAKERLNRKIADECDGIVAGLYEYWVCYKDMHKGKTVFIPFPIKPQDAELVEKKGKLKIFIGINKARSEYKGTDIMLKAAEAIARDYPEQVEIEKAESVPFKTYEKMMNGSDVILDQLYSYTPAMNALLAMSKGIICVGGGEEENYDIINETKLRPIINVTPDYQSVYESLKKLALLNDEEIMRLKRQSVEYIHKHHDYKKVAAQYVDFYEQILSRKTKGKAL